MIWNIIGPVIVLIISIGFTIWHTRKLRRENIRHAYKDEYMAEVNQWADSTIQASRKMNSYITDDLAELTFDIANLTFEGVRLTAVKPLGERLYKALDKVLDLLSLFPEDRGDQKKVEELKLACFDVKDIITELKYKS